MLLWQVVWFDKVPFEKKPSALHRGSALCARSSHHFTLNSFPIYFGMGVPARPVWAVPAGPGLSLATCLFQSVSIMNLFLALMNLSCSSFVNSTTYVGLNHVIKHICFFSLCMFSHAVASSGADFSQNDVTTTVSPPPHPCNLLQAKLLVLISLSKFHCGFSDEELIWRKVAFHLPPTHCSALTATLMSNIYHF